mgnify:CR=1 FL=1
MESTAGILLFVAAVAAIVLDNSPAGRLYDLFLSMPISFQAGNFILKKPSYLWINDGLMAVYFLLIGIEIKREMLFGELKEKSQAILERFEKGILESYRGETNLDSKYRQSMGYFSK